MTDTERCAWCEKWHTPGPEHCLSGIVLVCGGRDYADREHVFHTLDALAERRVEVLGVRHGACGLDADEPFDAKRLRGADRWAHEWALEHGHPVDPVPAAWNRLGKPAGPQRNQEMLVREEKPVCVVALPGGKGARVMVALAKRAGLPVWEVKERR